MTANRCVRLVGMAPDTAAAVLRLPVMAAVVAGPGFHPVPFELVKRRLVLRTEVDPRYTRYVFECSADRVSVPCSADGSRRMLDRLASPFSGVPRARLPRWRSAHRFACHGL